MSHLSIERLAALADEQPNAEESTHLAKCAECMRELDAIRSLVSLAGAERGSMSVPLTRWDTLSAKLKSEGLVADTKHHAPSTKHRFFSSRAALQIAAGFLILAAGMGAGRMSMGGSPLPGGFSGNEPRTASTDSMPADFKSVADAQAWQQLYSNRYQATVDYISAHDSSSRTAQPAMMRTRLSALDRVSRAMREALADAPSDPVINDIYLNSFAQREATLRQLSAAPQGARLTGF